MYTYYIKPPVYYYILTFENVRGFQGAARLVTRAFTAAHTPAANPAPPAASRPRPYTDRAPARPRALSPKLARRNTELVLFGSWPVSNLQVRVLFELDTRRALLRRAA